MMTFMIMIIFMNIMMIFMIIMMIMIIMNIMMIFMIIMMIFINIMLILIEYLHHQKKFSCVCMYKMNVLTLFTASAWKKMMLRL